MDDEKITDKIDIIFPHVFDKCRSLDLFRKLNNQWQSDGDCKRCRRKDYCHIICPACRKRCKKLIREYISKEYPDNLPGKNI